MKTTFFVYLPGFSLSGFLRTQVHLLLQWQLEFHKQTAFHIAILSSYRCYQSYASHSISLDNMRCKNMSLTFEWGEAVVNIVSAFWISPRLLSQNSRSLEYFRGMFKRQTHRFKYFEVEHETSTEDKFAKDPWIYQKWRYSADLKTYKFTYIWPYEVLLKSTWANLM